MRRLRKSGNRCNSWGQLGQSEKHTTVGTKNSSHTKFRTMRRADRVHKPNKLWLIRGLA